MIQAPPDVASIRHWFPALAGDTVYLENAGGSQVPAVVADAVRDYMRTTYVQLGAGYAVADRCDEVVAAAHGFASLLMNGGETGTVALGPSSSQLCAMLAGAWAERLEPGDEIVVMESGHEANIGPWTRLAARGAVVRTWRADPVTGACSLEGLAALLNERTRIVAIVHVSNLLGGIVDVAAVADLVHGAGARLVVDGVAFAPHRAIDVAAWDVDWYVFSTYKVYGPHMAALYGRHDAVAEITGPNHFFVDRADVPYKLELGGVNHEGCAGLLALGGYLRFLAGFAAGGAAPRGETIDRGTVVDAFGVMTSCEAPLQERMLGYLAGKPRVRVVGPTDPGPARVGTISFVHETLPSAEIAAAAHRAGIGIRHGHMYAYRLCAALGLDPEDGVVRVSLVHYNTLEEIERLIAVLDAVL